MSPVPHYPVVETEKPTYEEVLQALLDFYKTDFHVCHESECHAEQWRVQENARKLLERAKLLP